MSKNALKEAAIDYARRGWYILPCRADKTPYTEHGVSDASNDLKQIEEWWEKWPAANPAVNCGRSGLLVLDFDPGHDLKAVEKEVGELPATLTATTPRGGFHKFFDLGLRKPFSSPVGVWKNVDARCFQAYVLLAPSRTADGEYVWDNNLEPNPVWDKLAEVCEPTRDKDPERNEWLIEPDLPHNVEKAVRWLNFIARPAIQGRHGDQDTYEAACMMRSFGISEATALELMLEHYNKRCIPPWKFDGMEAKVKHAYRYYTSAPGNMTDDYKAEKRRRSLEFKPVVTTVGARGRKVETDSGFRIVDYEGLHELPEVQWLIEDFIVEGGHTLLAGAGGTYKTFLALDVALTVATGGRAPWEREEWQGSWAPPIQPGPVLFMAGEGRTGILQRVKAWAQYHAMPMDRLRNFYCMDPVLRPSLPEEQRDEIYQSALSLSPEGFRFVVTDTISRSIQGMDENSFADGSKYTMLIQEMQRMFGCANLSLHHMRKDGSQPRGHSVFVADSDVAFSAEVEGNRKHVRMTMLKDHKDAEPWTDARIFDIKPVHLWQSENTSIVIAPSKIKPTEVQENFEPRKTKRPERGARGKRLNPNSIWGGMNKMEAINDIALRVLKSNPQKTFSNRKLGQAMADYRPDPEGLTCGLGHNILANAWLPELRQEDMKVYEAARYYDSKTEQWVYKGEKK